MIELSKEQELKASELMDKVTKIIDPLKGGSHISIGRSYQWNSSGREYQIASIVVEGSPYPLPDDDDGGQAIYKTWIYIDRNDSDEKIAQKCELFRKHLWEEWEKAKREILSSYEIAQKHLTNGEII